MKILIAGGGRVGAALAARLVSAGHAVTVVERDREVADRIFEAVGAVTIVGDATDPTTLDAAGLASADIAAAMLARDADNLAFAMLCRARAGAKVMVRMLDGTYEAAYRLAGAREIIAEADVVVSKLVSTIEFPDVGGIIPLSNGEMILFELPIDSRALVAGKTVAQVRADQDFPRDCVFIALIDPQGETELPSGATVLRSGRTVVLVARRDQLSRAVSYLTAEPSYDREALAGLTAALRRIDIMAPLDEGELAELARGITLVRRSAGTWLFHRGDPGDEFYLVLAGEISLVGEDGREKEAVRAGGFFGEVALLTGEPRTMDARVTEECELISIGRDDFRRVLMANPALALEMSRILGQRLASAARGSNERRRRGFFSRG